MAVINAAHLAAWGNDITDKVFGPLADNVDSGNSAGATGSTDGAGSVHADTAVGAGATGSGYYCIEHIDGPDAAVLSEWESDSSDEKARMRLFHGGPN